MQIVLKKMLSKIAKFMLFFIVNMQKRRYIWKARELRNLIKKRSSKILLKRCFYKRNNDVHVIVIHPVFSYNM